MNFKHVIIFSFMSLFWALNFPLVKVAYNYSDPYWLLFLRVLFSALFSLLISYRILFIPNGFVKNIIILVMGIFNTIIFMGFWFIGESYVSSSLSTIVIYTYPIISLILSRFFLDEKLGKLSIIGSALGLFGIILIFSENLYVKSMVGFIFLILSAIGFSSATIIYRKFLRDLDPLVVNTLQFLYVLPLNLLPLFLSGTIIHIPNAINFYLIAFYMGSLGTAVAYLFYMILIKNYRISYVSSFLFFVPALSVLLSILILKEIENFIIYFGFALIALGIYISYKGNNKKNS